MKKLGPFKSDAAVCRNAGRIFKQAFDEAFEGGYEIAVRRGDNLILIQKGHPDKFLKKLEPATKIAPGTVFKLT
jgi:hypothetical protein